MPRSADMGDVTRLDPTARIPESAGGAQRRVVASVPHLNPDTRITVTTPTNKFQRLASSLGIIAGGIGDAEKAVTAATDKEFENGIAQGELKQAQGSSREDAKALGEVVGWDRAAGAAAGRKIGDQLASMAADGKTEAERTQFLEEQMKGLSNQDKHFISTLAPSARQGIERANAIEFNRAQQAKQTAKEDALQQEALAAVDGLSAGDDVAAFNEKGRQFFTNASSMGIPREKAERMAVDAVFAKAWDTMKDGNFSDTEEYLTLLSEKQRSGNTYLSSPANQEYILKKIAAVRGFMDNEEKLQKEQRGKMLEAEEVRANNEYKDDTPEVLRQKKAEQLNRKTDDYDELQKRKLNVSIINGFLAAAGQENGYIDEEKRKTQNEREDKLVRDELLMRSNLTDDDLRQEFSTGDLSAQTYQHIKSIRGSSGARFLQEIHPVFMGKLDSYMPKNNDEDKLREPEVITLKDGQVLRPTRAQLDGAYTDFAKEFIDWYGQKQRDPANPTERLEIENKREEFANRALRPYGKKLYADGEAPQTFLKDKDSILPNKEERNADWLNKNPQRQDALIRDYNSAPNAASRAQWMQNALHPDEKKWLVSEVWWRNAAEEHKKLEAEAVKEYGLQQWDAPAPEWQTIYRVGNNGMEMVDVHVPKDLKNGSIPFLDSMAFQMGNKLSPGSVPLPEAKYPDKYSDPAKAPGTERIKLTGIEAEKAFILRSLEDKEMPDRSEYFNQRFANERYTAPDIQDYLRDDARDWKGNHTTGRALKELVKEGAVKKTAAGSYELNKDYDPMAELRLMLEQEPKKKGK